MQEKVTKFIFPFHNSKNRCLISDLFLFFAVKESYYIENVWTRAPIAPRSSVSKHESQKEEEGCGWG